MDYKFQKMYEKNTMYQDIYVEVTIKASFHELLATNHIPYRKHLAILHTKGSDS